jgi:hypothetical protein
MRIADRLTEKYNDIPRGWQYFYSVLGVLGITAAILQVWPYSVWGQGISCGLLFAGVALSIVITIQYISRSSYRRKYRRNVPNLMSPSSYTTISIMLSLLLGTIFIVIFIGIF